LSVLDTRYVNLPETSFPRSTTSLHFTLSRIHLYNLFYTTNFILHIKYNCTVSDWVRGDSVNWATVLQDEDCGFDSRWGHWPWGRLIL